MTVAFFFLHELAEFVPSFLLSCHSLNKLLMPEITPNVSFDTIAVSCRMLLRMAEDCACLHVPARSNAVSASSSQREWRCKWSPDADKASLSSAQEALAEILAEVRSPPFALCFPCIAYTHNTHMACGKHR